MSVNLLKPALRVNDMYEFAQRQRLRLVPYGGGHAYPVWTSRKPARAGEMVDGGSVYWIIRNQISCRQKILTIEECVESGEEKPSYLILCSPELVRVKPISKRAFQGWRYLETDQAPSDIGEYNMDDAPPPPALGKILREAGLI
jgi:hypothetical protein